MILHETQRIYILKLLEPPLGWNLKPSIVKTKLPLGSMMSKWMGQKDVPNSPPKKMRKVTALFKGILCFFLGPWIGLNPNRPNFTNLQSPKKGHHSHRCVKQTARVTLEKWKSPKRNTSVFQQQISKGTTKDSSSGRYLFYLQKSR